MGRYDRSKSMEVSSKLFWGVTYTNRHCFLYDSLSMNEVSTVDPG